MCFKPNSHVYNTGKRLFMKCSSIHIFIIHGNIAFSCILYKHPIQNEKIDSGIFADSRIQITNVKTKTQQYFYRYKM